MVGFTNRLLAALLVLTPVTAVHGQSAALSTEEAADIERIEDYLNGLTTMDSRFVQLSDGTIAQGRIRLSRPGRLRIDYEPPVPVRIVASGRFMLYYDHELEQTTYVPVSRTPAYFLLQEEVDLSERIAITDFEKDAATIRVTAIEQDSPENGSLTVVFEDNPLRLVKWQVVDPQGQRVDVALLDPHFGVNLDNDLFSTVDPTFLSDDN